jgi:hypothetical protein
MSTVGLRSEKGCAGDAGNNWKVQTRPLVREGAPHQQTRNRLKIIKERMGEIGRSSQMGAWHQDWLADWHVGRNITLTLADCHNDRLRGNNDQSQTSKYIHKCNKQTPWPKSARELYRPSDRRLLAKLAPTFLRIEGAKWSVWQIPTAVFSDF